MNILGKRVIFQSPIGFRSIENPATPIGDYIRGGVGSSSVDPNKANGITLSTLLAILRIISEDFASLPFQVFEKQKGYYKPIDHDLNYLLGVKPNANQNAFNFKETFNSDVYHHGNGLAFIDFGGPGAPIRALDYVDPMDLEPFYVKNTGKVEYKIPGQNSKKTYPATQILHVPFFRFTPKYPKSRSPFDLLKESIRVGLNARQHANSMHQNGGFPSLVLEHPMQLSDKATKRLQNSVQEQAAGVGNVGKVFVAEEGMKARSISLSAADTKLLEQRKFTSEELQRPFRIPSHMLQNLDRATNNNIEQMSLEYVMYCLRPLAKRYESEFQSKLLTRDDWEKGLRFKVNLRALLRGDVKTQTDHINKMVVSGVMSRNEGRDFLGLPPVEGLDEMLTPVNLFNPEKEQDNGEDN